MDALKDHDESGCYITREIKVHRAFGKGSSIRNGYHHRKSAGENDPDEKWFCQHFADKSQGKGISVSHALRSASSWIQGRMRPDGIGVGCLYFIALI